MKRSFTLVWAVGAAVSLGGGHAAVAQEFRVKPYLMSPTTEAMTVVWWTVGADAGTLTVTGPGLAKPLVFTTSPVNLPETWYSPAEEAARASSPDMFPASSNWKHAVRVEGLQPGAAYAYTATQGAATFSGTFRTNPAADSTDPIRLTVLSDSETLVVGRTTNREWSVGLQAAASTGRPSGTGRGRTTYLITETVGYRENIKAIKTRNPDLIVMPGDLIQGSGAEPQRRWDEFWRHNAGEYDTVLSTVPLVAAIGNNCIFYNSWSNNTTIQTARRQWSAYFDFPDNGYPQFADLFHRQDFGPVTILTLCSVKGVSPANHLVADRDTNRVWNNLYTFGDVPDLNRYLDGAAQQIESEQLQWLRTQLEDARKAGQVIFVQWHHVPYSGGIHGSQLTSTQSGEAMRQWTPLLEQYRVAAVFCGHSEVAERSFVDADGDGYGINYYDVGMAGDGLRGVETAFVNPFSEWTADQSEGEFWQGNRLLAGGKHYGFLEVDVEPLGAGQFRVTLQPYHVFPLNQGDENFTITGHELRRYNDLVVLEGAADNLQVVAGEVCPADFNADGVTNSTDVSDFINQWYFDIDAGTLETDFNRDGVLNTTDVADFVTVWIASPLSCFE